MELLELPLGLQLRLIADAAPLRHERTLLDGRYVCADRLENGCGTMGVVRHGFDTVCQRAVAIKTIPKNANWQNRREAILREVRTHSLVSDHPNVVTLYEALEDSFFYYLIMEYCSGGDLFSFVADGPAEGQPPEVCSRIMRQLMAGLQHLHLRGVIHADIKLEVLLTPSIQARCFV